DFRIGFRGMRLSVPAAKLGVCYPPGGLRRYLTRLGLGTASRILLAAEELEDDELLRTGYLTHLTDREELDSLVNELVGRLGTLAPLAVRNMKRGLLELAAGDPDPDALAGLVDECAASDDVKEGLRAWRDRRAPDFEGR
ncbi:MAG: enoyl-CoA hydratase/isomerase family protein, partial [Gemmatimonadetes bacterium]|nr:enoyl-CoA hydratase/isomerase family protein [Gemmatimonadota bacterium]